MTGDESRKLKVRDRVSWKGDATNQGTVIRSEHTAAIEQVRKSSVKILGLCSFLSNEGRRLIDRGDHDAGRRYLARAEALNAIKLPSPGVTQGEIIAAANDWSNRAADLRNGSSS